MASLNFHFILIFAVRIISSHVQMTVGPSYESSTQPSGFSHGITCHAIDDLGPKLGLN